MLLARLIRQLTRLRRLQPQVGRLQAVLLRRSGGRIKRSRVLAGGQPVLALTTTGRQSAKPRTTTLAYVRHEDAYAVTPLNLGSDRHPAWYLNLRADPRAVVHAAGATRAVRAREAEPAEADRLWDRFAAQFPQVRNTRRVTSRHVPVIVLEPRL